MNSVSIENIIRKAIGLEPEPEIEIEPDIKIEPETTTFSPADRIYDRSAYHSYAVSLPHDASNSLFDSVYY